ncbi:hypothetical protein BASA81_018137 [Batrachochytrium salamandrivorans]|nr:hypothetical protein BASA81_018137 [Batrachochytrium salamandrivorans]
MQFFYLFSFVVAASYAAALPQPEELSEKYSNNANTNSASGLEARSYQPGSNSHKDLATLVSLKRRGNSGSGSSSPPDTTPNETDSDPFSEENVSSENLASTIDKVGDGIADIYPDGEKVRQKISGPVGDMMARYLIRDVYVDIALGQWEHYSVPNIVYFIESDLNDDEYSKVGPYLAKARKSLENRVNTESMRILDATSNILKDVGSDIDNFETIHDSADLILHSSIALLFKLAHLLMELGTSETLQGSLFGINASISRFRKEQQKSYNEIMEKLEAARWSRILPTHPNSK